MTEEIFSNDYGISETFCEVFFASIVLNLKIIPTGNFESTMQREIEKPVQNAINKFKNYPNTKIIISNKSE